MNGIEYEFERLDEFYNNEIPGYVIDAGNDFLTIHIDDVLIGERDVKITIKDLVKYYVEQATNISSGIRTLSDVHGDWRCIDELAQECLEYFKFVNRDELAEEAEKFGLRLRH